MSNFLQRALTGIFFVVVVIGGIWLNQYMFFMLFLVITGLTCYEFYNLVRSNAVAVNPFVGAIGGALLFAVCFFRAKNDLLLIDGVYYSTSFFVILYSFFVIGLLIAELFRRKENPINNWAYYLLGQVMVALPFSLLPLIAFRDGFEPLWIIVLFALIWINDTGAYITGVLWGRHRLFERVSPKKSWEGFVGGLVLVVVAAVVVAAPCFEWTSFYAIGFAVVVVVFGTLGDLCESLLKRTLNVKDSGAILPGHGGLLDRFDSLLLVAPAAYLYLNIF